MKGRIPALILYARRVPSRRGMLVETLGRILGAVPSSEGAELGSLGRYLGFLDRNAYTSLSYVIDWLHAFRDTQILAPELVNVMDLVARRRARRLARDSELIVVLHSAAGDNLASLTGLIDDLCARRGRLVIFFGNEYTRMHEKIDFAKRTEADFIASQLPAAAGTWLYQPCPSAKILHAPAALNPCRYYPTGMARSVDIGFRGDIYPWSIGDDERTSILEHFRQHADDYGLSADIAYTRVSGEEWHEFMSRCHGTIGAESGTYYLERDNNTERAVLDYLAQNPTATFPDVKSRFFGDSSSAVSGKAISSRHFEAIGSKTCQILVEGLYNGLLIPDVHYLSVRKDFSNIDDVVARFRDPKIRSDIVEAAHAHVLANHTYGRRVRDLVSAALE